jgi:hypothetical protein
MKSLFIFRACLIIVTFLSLSICFYAADPAKDTLGLDSVVRHEIIPIGSERQLFTDSFLIRQIANVSFRLHAPMPKEIVMIRDARWEGSGSDFETIFRDGDIIRMYYIGYDLTSSDGTKMNRTVTGKQRVPPKLCYAESKDGIHWRKPELGIVSFQGSKKNNILWMDSRINNFTVFKDKNPDCRTQEQYKAVAGGPDGLFAMKSADGIHWSYLSSEPILTRQRFDSQNNAFWDSAHQQYWCYIRDFHDKTGKSTKVTSSGIRDIVHSVSKDFLTWSEPQRLIYPGSPDEALYTNAIRPYYRAPQFFLGFPARYTDREFSAAAMHALPDEQHRKRRMSYSPRFGTALSDGLFMSSRDGKNFHRWDEAFIKPGPERKDNWVYGDGFVGLGMIETPAEDTTSANEISLYVHENHWKGPTRLRRLTIRMDGFVSLHTSRKPGVVTTKLIIFSGNRLSLNFSTSAAGSIRIGIQDSTGKYFPGFSPEECDEIFGDSVDRCLSWHGNQNLDPLAGIPVVLIMEMQEADLYSFKFYNNRDIKQKKVIPNK